MRSVYAWILLLYLGVLQNGQTSRSESTDHQSCHFTVNQYRYTSKSIFHHLPTKIINRSQLTLTADVLYYQARTTCHPSFVQLVNVTVDPVISSELNTTQLVASIERFFEQIAMQATNQTLATPDGEPIRIRTTSTDMDRVKNNIILNFLLNKFLPSTVTTCDTSFNRSNRRLEKSTCRWVTVGLFTLDRQLIFKKQMDDVQSTVVTDKSSPIKKKNKNKTDLDRLFHQFCAKDDSTILEKIVSLSNEQLDLEDLKDVLRSNLTSHSSCHRNAFYRALIKVHRSPVTDFLLKHADSSIIEQHLNHLEAKIDPSTQSVLENHLQSSVNQFSPFVTLRLLLLLQNDEQFLSYASNRRHRLDYRTIALRSLTNPQRFETELRRLFADEEESNEIRCVAFQTLRSSFNDSDLAESIERTRSKQFRAYLKSLSNQSSLWLGQSGIYQFPFGTVHAIFNDLQPRCFPSLIQLEFEQNTSIDLYWIKNENRQEDELLLVTNRKLIHRFTTLRDFFHSFTKDRSLEIPTLDGFSFHIDLEFNGFDTNQRPWNEYFSKSTIGVTLKIHHGLGPVRTGFAVRLHLESNFRIEVRQTAHSTSYLWFAKQKENSLIKIEQRMEPMFIDADALRKEFHTSPAKDFCYILPHFDSKLCFTLVFDRLWSSSLAIRLLSDDASLVYNMTRSDQSIDFHVQHHQKPIRSLHFQHKYDPWTGLPSHFEFRTSKDRFQMDLHWNNESQMTCRLSKNHQGIVNGSGKYHYDASRGISVNLTEISPEHLGRLSIDYTKKLSLDTADEWTRSLSRLKDWKRIRIESHIDQAFFFFQEHYCLDLYYNWRKLSFYLTLERNQQSNIRLAFIDDPSYFYQSFVLNTSLIELDYYTQVHYENISDLTFRSSSTINSWTLWNISCATSNLSQIHLQLNQWSTFIRMDYPTFEVVMNFAHLQLFRWHFHRQDENHLLVSVETPQSSYRGVGELIANHTDFTLDLPIVEANKKRSHGWISFRSDDSSVIVNVTFNYRSIASLRCLQNFTFLHRYLSRSLTDLRVQVMDYSLLSFYSQVDFKENSTVLQFWNGSLHLPPLFVSQPMLWLYENQSAWFLQFFQWANVTRRSSSVELTTNFGLKIFTMDNILTRISVGIEQYLLGHRLEFLFEIDRHWILSVIVNKQTRYELKSFLSESSLRLSRINLRTNETRQLLINYHTDDHTMLRLEVLFSKYFSAFINDFIIDVSLRNQTMKFLLHIPLFKKEFFSITWKRAVPAELFHFQGNIQIYLLRRRRLIHYDYNWNMASFSRWTLDSRLSLFSSDPIESHLNWTNHYLWSGYYAIDYRLFLANRRDLIRLHHDYQNFRSISKISFDLDLFNDHYLLNVNYSQLNRSIQGQFMKNKHRHPLHGWWNASSHTLHLNTDEMTSVTVITSSLIKSIIDKNEEKFGFLIERTIDLFTNDSDILQCNPYLIVQSRARLFHVQYYTLNDGLTTMIYEWSSHSYFSWNYTGHGRSFIPIRKIEWDTRKNYLFRFHTNTYRYSSIYHVEKRQLILRRIPVADDADDCFDLRTRIYSNRTFFFHLQVINNHYRIVASPVGEDLSWILHGYFRHDRLNGSLMIARSDWWFSSQFIFNSTLYISTGSYVQFIPRSDPQFALEIRWKNQTQFLVQYAGWQSLFALKMLFPFWNLNLTLTSQSMDTNIYHIQFQLNSQIERHFTLELNNEHFYLNDRDSEFQVNGSVKEFAFRHTVDDQATHFIYNADTIQFLTNRFGFLVSNRTSETSRYIHFYHRQWKSNVTIFYYKEGRFYRDKLNIQTPIYDIQLIYHPTDETNRYVKLIWELLPLQMSAFSFVRGRSFRIGYQTENKQAMLEGNLAFTLEDFSQPRIILMNERWKFLFGYEKDQRLFLRWNLRIDSENFTVQGRMTVQDPQDRLSSPVYCDIHGYRHQSWLVAQVRTVYTSPSDASQTIHFRIQADQRLTSQQNVSMYLNHPLSNTNLSLNIDRYPQRKLRLALKPNGLNEAETLIHLYANRSESQIYLMTILHQLIHLNLTLPKSYPETGILYSELFMDNEEYFNVYFETSALKLRTKDYLLNLSLTQLNLQKRDTLKTVASIVGRWLERNSSTGLITIITPTSFPRTLASRNESADEPTWLTRFQNFFFRDQLFLKFVEDYQTFSDRWKEDFIREQRRFAEPFFDALQLDEDAQLALQQINTTMQTLVRICFQLGLEIESSFQEYLNNLTCFKNHRNLLQRNFTDVAGLLIETVIHQLVGHVNRTSNILHHFSRNPRSVGVLLTYLLNEVTLEVYKQVSQYYLESKEYVLTKALEYSKDMELVLKLSALIFKSFTILTSRDLQTIFSFVNDRFRQLVTSWLNSPIERKLMQTVATALVEWTDRLRFYLDDRFDSLLPDLRIYTPRFEQNHTINETFLFTWSREKTSVEHH